MNGFLKLAMDAKLLDEEGSVNGEYDYDEQIIMFAKLVAAAERAVCLKIAEEINGCDTVQAVVNAIRARGNDAA